MATPVLLECRIHTQTTLSASVTGKCVAHASIGMGMDVTASLTSQRLISANIGDMTRVSASLGMKIPAECTIAMGMDLAAMRMRGVEPNQITGPIIPMGVDVEAALMTYTSSKGDNKDLTFVALEEDSLASIEVQVSGVDTPLAVTVDWKQVIVTSATDSGGLASSTASDIMAAINADPDASLLMEARLAYGSTGAGIFGDLDRTHLDTCIGAYALHFAFPRNSMYLGLVA